MHSPFFSVIFLISVTFPLAYLLFLAGLTPYYALIRLREAYRLYRMPEPQSQG